MQKEKLTEEQQERIVRALENLNKESGEAELSMEDFVVAIEDMALNYDN